MAITTFSSQEFTHDFSRAKKAAASGPVFITDRGRPAHVLISIDEYRKLTGASNNILELLAMPDATEDDFEAPRAGSMFRPPDLS